MRPVFVHGPNERPEPTPLTIFDFTNCVVGFPCERRHVFWGDPSGWRRTLPHPLRRSKMGYRRAVAHLSIVVTESYALKELSEAEMRRVEKHVARCPKCRDRLEGELGWSAAR